MKDTFLQALKSVIDPDLKQDVVSLGMVQHLEVNPPIIELTLRLTTPACPLKGYFEKACYEALRPHMPENWELQVAFTAPEPPKEQSLPIQHILLVGSGKGGVGKSTIATNLAIALAQSGARVGLLDADIYGPSTPILLGLEHRKPHVLEKDGKPYLEPLFKYGIYAQSIGFLVREQATPWRGPMASNTLRQLIQETLWPPLDYLIVDMPPGTGDIHITLAQQFRPRGALLVTTPQKVACADTEKLILMFQMPLVRVPLLGIVENMSYFYTPLLPQKPFYLFGQGGGQALAQKYDIPLLGEIPLTEAIIAQSDQGIPVALQKTTQEGELFTALAGKVAQRVAMLTHAENAAHS
ncbi:MAG: Mrp/NBP35 family ATP-binding protein [Bacteroidia bacterium]